VSQASRQLVPDVWTNSQVGSIAERDHRRFLGSKSDGGKSSEDQRQKTAAASRNINDDGPPAPPEAVLEGDDQR
jgi:hypothetical protein